MDSPLLFASAICHKGFPPEFHFHLQSLRHSLGVIYAALIRYCLIDYPAWQMLLLNAIYSIFSVSIRLHFLTGKSSLRVCTSCSLQ